MNQNSDNLNPNNINTQGNNGIPNNQPLNNQYFNQQTNNFQQPINQINIQQSTPQTIDNSYENENASNKNLNNKTLKKMNYGLIIGIVTIVIVVVSGIVLFKNANNSNSNGTFTDKNNNKNELYYNYSNNKNTNNITFTWSKQKNTLYAINIESDNISKDIIVNNSKIGNDVFQVSEYGTYSNLTIKNLNNYNLVFSLTDSWQNQTFDPNRELINENNNQLLVHEFLGGEKYVVYIKTDQKYVRVNANITDENLATNYFNYINNHIKVATINYETIDNTYDKLDLSSAKQNDSSIDISSWTFANDLIADVFRKNGLNIKSSSDITSFFVNDGYQINVLQKLKDESKITALSYTITSATKGTYDKKNSVMEFKTGKSNWKITGTSNYHDYAKVKTNNEAEYSIEISYRNYDSEEVREIIKNSIIKYFE